MPGTHLDKMARQRLGQLPATREEWREREQGKPLHLPRVPDELERPAPQNLPRATKLGWRAADAMWHAAGDTATDFNHYSKRGILGGVYMATIMAMMDDESEGYADTRAFLGRRIDGIMRFEKFKGRFTHSAPERLSLARFLGRLRYPAV